MNDEPAVPENPYANSTFDDTENVNVFAVAGVLALTFGVVLVLLGLGFVGLLLLGVTQVLPGWLLAIIGSTFGLVSVFLAISGAKSLLAWLKTQ